MKVWVFLATMALSVQCLFATFFPPYGNTRVLKDDVAVDIGFGGFDFYSDGDPRVLSGTAAEFLVSFRTGKITAPYQWTSWFPYEISLSIGGKEVEVLQPPLPTDPLATMEQWETRNWNTLVRFSTCEFPNGVADMVVTGEAVLIRNIPPDDDDPGEFLIQWVPIQATAKINIYNRSVVWRTTLIDHDTGETSEFDKQYPDAALEGATYALSRLANYNIPALSSGLIHQRPAITGPPTVGSMVQRATVLFAFTHGTKESLYDSIVTPGPGGASSQSLYMDKEEHFQPAIASKGAFTGSPPDPYPDLTLALHYACSTAFTTNIRNQWFAAYNMTGKSNRAYCGFEKPVWSTLFAGNTDEKVITSDDPESGEWPDTLLSKHSERLLQTLATKTLSDAVNAATEDFAPRTVEFTNGLPASGGQAIWRKLPLLITGDGSTTIRPVYTSGFPAMPGFSGVSTPPPPQQATWYVTSSVLQ